MLVGAPLGNVADASVRLKTVLHSVNVIAAEDTRRLKRLLSDLEIDTDADIVSYFEGNEQTKTGQLVARLEGGDDIAVITDGGMPSVSDPGYRLVTAAIDVGVPLTAVPGPSAPTTALAVSGLPSDRFIFEGFLPRKSGEASRRLAEVAHQSRTTVFFESPRRIEATLAQLCESFGSQRQAALCREMTKTYEEVRRGTLASLLDGARDDPPRGEITLVVAGWDGPDGSEATPERLAAEVEALEETGLPRKEAMRQVARQYGLKRRDVYEALLSR